MDKSPTQADEILPVSSRTAQVGNFDHNSSFPDHHCPQCGGSIRGKTLLSLKYGRKIDIDQANVTQCPYCHSLLECLDNTWKTVSLLVVMVSMIVNPFVKTFMTAPILAFSLDCITLAGLTGALIAMVAFPRFRLFLVDKGR